MSDLGLSQGISAMCPLSCGELKERQRGEERKERERDSTWHVSHVQRVDALTIGIWLMFVCALDAWDMYILGVEAEWCVLGGRGVTEGVMTNLAPRQFWSLWLVRDGAWCLYVSGISCAKSELKKGDPVWVNLQRMKAWNSAGKGWHMSSHMLHLLTIWSVINCKHKIRYIHRGRYPSLKMNFGPIFKGQLTAPPAVR